MQDMDLVLFLMEYPLCTTLDTTQGPQWKQYGAQLSSTGRSLVRGNNQIYLSKTRNVISFYFVTTIL